MRLERLMITVCFLLILFLSFGCADVKPRSNPEGQNGGAGVTPSESAPPSMFPHPAAWVTPSSHGGYVNQYGRQACLACHKISSASTETIPTCNSCHALYPHSSGWAQKENHGAHVLRQGQDGCTTQCHGIDLKGGLSGISCNACHTIFPHTDSWESPSEHGNTAKGDGKALCKGCHGDDLLGGTSNISCKQCHVHYPHETNWRNKENHGQWVATNGNASCATPCHGTDLRGGLSQISCNSCHAIYPHADQWQQNHGATANRTGKSACQGCHGSDFRQVLNGKNCYSCHADYPHPAQDSWIPFRGGHGEKIKSAYRGSTDSCESCHGDDLTEMKQGKNCFTCHSSYPHRNISTSDWDSYEGHGQYILNTLRNSKEECKACHGIDLRGSRGNPSCYSCHTSYPHMEGWKRPSGQVQEHAIYVRANGTNSCATARCHGEELIPTPGITQGNNCTGCHRTYPHIPAWASGTNHGRQALVDADSMNGCKSCHGANLDRRTSSALTGHGSCAECHSSYLRHRTARIGSRENIWARGSEHGGYVLDSGRNRESTLRECQYCHGSDYTGGLSGQSCKSSTCHESYPHPSGWAPAEGGSSSSHGSTAAANFDACRACHGRDLNRAPGGRGVCSSAGCHPSYAPHQTGNSRSTTWNTYDGHGVSLLGSGPTPSPVGTRYNECKPCHGSDLARIIRSSVSSRPEGQNCNSCHASYPHQNSTVWRTREGHGAYVRTQGSTASCATARCHGLGLIPSADTRGPGCNNAACHQNYPHSTSADWTRPAAGPSSHGITAISNIASCQRCHGTTLNNVLSTTLPRGGSCNNCHPSYSQHPRVAPSATPAWSSTGHGQYILGPASARHSPEVKAAKEAECQVCHGSDYSGGVSGVACSSCHNHESYPQLHRRPGWNTYNDSGNGHGNHVLVNLANRKASCKLCHGDDFRGGNSGVDCSNSRCHANYPHGDPASFRSFRDDPVTLSWVSTRHGPAALGGQDARRTNCGSANCHGSDLRGRTVATVQVYSCFLCHSQFPHGTDWMTPGRTTGNHALEFIAGRGCSHLCHGASGDRNLDGRTCTTCHPNGVTHTSSWWISGTVSLEHGTYYRRYYNSNSPSIPPGGSEASTPVKQNCGHCHGDASLPIESRVMAVDFNSSDTLSSLQTQSSCYRCHYAYPHKSYTSSSLGRTPGRQDWAGLGHDYFVAESPLFMDGTGSHPSSPSDRNFLDARRNSCEQGGKCHTYRITTLPEFFEACGGGPGGCHRPGP